jgi:hypothetical protein
LQLSVNRLDLTKPVVVVPASKMHSLGTNHNAQCAQRLL